MLPPLPLLHCGRCHYVFRSSLWAGHAVIDHPLAPPRYPARTPPAAAKLGDPSSVAPRASRGKA
jgi:hypothetical protein